MSPARPRPVYAPNTLFAELRTAELFVVSSLRLWVLPHRDPGGSHRNWREGFLRAGIATAGADGFDTLFGVIASVALRSLDVRRPRCPHLGEDEAWLLQLGSVLQQRRARDATAILGEWLPPAAVRIVMEPAERFALALAECGLHLPRRHAEAASAHQLAPSPYAARGLALVH